MTTAVLPKSQARPSRKARHDTLIFYLCVAPWVIGFIAFTLGPMLYSLYISFTEWGMLKPPVWVGLENYTNAFKDPDFYTALKVTSFYTVFSIPTTLFTALFLAILLNEATRGVGFFRTAFYMPAIVASVAAAVLWTWILNPKFGPINGLLRLVGLPGPNWFSDPKYVLWGFVMMSAWNVGGQMLIFLAGLKGIPKALYEAAEIDGAGRWPRFWQITIPMLSSTLFFNFVMAVIGSLQTFDTAYVIGTASGGTLGGPAKATLFYMIYVYSLAFKGFNSMGYATALAWILFAITLLLTLLVLRTSSLWVYYESEKGG
jgi:multiple sugar transport system permease protein